MNVIVIVDDNGGLMFNHRRLSSDRIVTSRILTISQHTVLRMDPYSSELFSVLPDNAMVSDDFLDEAKAGDICFVEDRPLLPYSRRIDTFYLFHWNRSYPSDMKLDFIPSDNHMSLRKTEDFAGYSHEKITLEIWQK